MKEHTRHGAGTVRPYVHGPLGILHFLAEVFAAEEIERHEFGPESFHVELRIGDSVLVVEAGSLPPGVKPWTNSIYVYVPDVDAAFDRAVALGATVVAAPADKPYKERQAGFRDEAGNTWWISTFKGS